MNQQLIALLAASIFAGILMQFVWLAFLLWYEIGKLSRKFKRRFTDDVPTRDKVRLAPRCLYHTVDGYDLTQFAKLWYGTLVVGTVAAFLIQVFWLGLQEVLA